MAAKHHDAAEVPEAAYTESWGSTTFEMIRLKCVSAAYGPSNLSCLLQPRNLVLGVSGRVGALCDCLRRPAAECTLGLPSFARTEREQVALEIGSALSLLIVLAHECYVDLPQALLLKIELNAKKYPAALVRGSSQKYDAYEEHTGFRKGSKQVMTDGAGGEAHLSGHYAQKWRFLTFQDLRAELQRFAAERNWIKFHTPRNICMALSGETGELCELFQWKDEEACARGLPGWTSDERDELAQELSDVCIYLCRLSDLCSVNLPTALRDERIVLS